MAVCRTRVKPNIRGPVLSCRTYGRVQQAVRLCVCVHVMCFTGREVAWPLSWDRSIQSEWALQQASWSDQCVHVCVCCLYGSLEGGEAVKFPLNNLFFAQWLVSWSVLELPQVCAVALCGFLQWCGWGGQRGNAISKLHWSASGSNRVFDERIHEPWPRQFQASWHFQLLAGGREVGTWSSIIVPTLLRKTMLRNKTKISVTASVNHVKWEIPVWDLVWFICQHIFRLLGFLLRSDLMPFYFCFF